MRINDVLSFLIDTIFAWYFLRRYQRQQPRKASFLVIVGYLFLLCTIYLYRVGVTSFAHRFALNIFRFTYRFVCYATFGLLSCKKDISHSIYHSLFVTLTYTLVHNIFLTPVTRPLLMGTAIITGINYIDRIICLLIIIISRVIIYFIVYKVTPYADTDIIYNSRYLVFTLIFITSIFLRYFQQMVNDHSEDIQLDANGLSLYFTISQLVFLICIVYQEVDRFKTIENIEYRIQNVAADAMLTNMKTQQLMDQQTRESRHNLKNHYLTLSILLRDGHIKEAQDYLDEELKNISNIYDNSYHTGNVLADGLLTTKLGPASKLDVKVDVIADFSQLNVISTNDICVILGNLIDNAVEGSMQGEKKEEQFIRIKGNVSAGFLIVNIENSCTKDLKIKGTSLLPLTTKKEKQFHGYGLQSVKKTIEKYHGELEIQAENGIFTAAVIIPLT